MRATGFWVLCLALAMAGGFASCSGKKTDAEQQAQPTEPSAAVAQPSEPPVPPAPVAPASQGDQEPSASQPPGAPPSPADMAEAMKAMAAMNQAAGGPAQMGPVVNWRELAGFVPDKVADFAPSGELDGSTGSVGAMQVTKVSRRYKAGQRSLKVEISDTSMAPMLRMPFAMAAMVNEDTSRGYRRGKQIAGQTALVEWNERRQESKATLLVGGRYLVEVEVDKAGKQDEAETIAGKLDLKGLAALKAKAAE